MGEIAHLHQHCVGAAHQNGPHGRGGHAARMTLEERPAHHFFNFRKGSRGGGLRQLERLRRQLDLPVLGNGRNEPQMGELQQRQ